MHMQARILLSLAEPTQETVMTMPPMNKPEKKPADSERRAQANEDYRLQQAEIERKRKIMLSRFEPTVDVDVGRSNFEMSLAISMKRIADTLDQILIEMRASNQKVK